MCSLWDNVKQLLPMLTKYCKIAKFVKAFLIPLTTLSTYNGIIKLIYMQIYANILKFMQEYVTTTDKSNKYEK